MPQYYYRLVLYGTYGVWSYLMGATFPPFYQAWVRSLLIIIMMTPFMVATKSFRRIDRTDWPAFGIFLVFCICTQVPLYYAYNHAPIGAVQLIFYSMFIVTAYIVGRFYLGETMTKVKLLSMALAITGLAVVFGSSVIVFAPLGLALAAFTGIASGGETSSTKKVSDRYPPALIAFWVWVSILITHLILSLTLHENQLTPQLDRAWLWLVLYSIVNAVAFWLAVVGYKFVDASIASIIGLNEVIFAIVFGAIIFHQSLSWSVAIGGILILLAAMLPDLINIVSGKKTAEPVEPIRET